MDILAKRICELREQHNMLQDELACILCVDRSTVAKYECVLESLICILSFALLMYLMCLLTISSGEPAELNKNSIIESDRNDNGYYEKYANGECRMWGTASVASNGICTVNLPIPFSDVTYRPYATPVYNPENTHAVTIASVQNDTTSRFYIYAREIDGTIPKTGTKYNWEVKGTWK